MYKHILFAMLISLKTSVLIGGGFFPPESLLSRADSLAMQFKKGINLDVSPAMEGNPVKWIYEEAQLDAIKDAGFTSIRIFVVAMQDPSIYKTLINDALERDLAVLICLWGDTRWVSDPKKGLDEFVEVWEKYAEYYKDYPDALAFELLNEPSGLTDTTAMKFLNAVIPAIRKSNPNRLLGIGSPGLNECKKLYEYVNPEYLTYTIDDSSGFEEDENLMGIVHMYYPYPITHWTGTLNNSPGWQDEVSQALAYPATWAEEWDKPVILSEWGAWAPPSRSSSDFKTYLQFVFDECEMNNIGQIYYSAGFNNQWGFSILDSEKGWSQDALDILTDVTAPPVPPLSPIINAEFGWSTDSWNTTGSADISVSWNAGLSGSSAMKVTATASEKAEVFQETPTQPGSPPNRYLISMQKGKRYTISFLARAVGTDGTIKVRLSNVASNGSTLWTSEPIAVSMSEDEYEVSYSHRSESLKDVRLSFLFNEKNQVVLMDRIAMHGYPDTTPSNISYSISGLIDSTFYAFDEELPIQIDATSDKGNITSILLFLNNDSITGSVNSSLNYSYYPNKSERGWNVFSFQIYDNHGSSVSDSLFVHFGPPVFVLHGKEAKGKIYPNPSPGKLNILGDGMASLFVYNMQGTMVASFSNLNEQQTIDFSKLEKGMYIIQLENEMSRYETHKILFQ